MEENTTSEVSSPSEEGSISSGLIMVVAALILGAVLLYERVSPTGSLNPVHQAKEKAAQPQPCYT